MKRKLYSLIIEIIEKHFNKKLLHLESQPKYERFIAVFVDGAEEVITYSWMLLTIEKLFK